MSDRPTPETDAIECKVVFWQMTEHAKKLERQRDAALSEVAALRQQVEGMRENDARYRWLRRKICFTGNGDGTSSMCAINLPDAKGFPQEGQHHAFIDAAIDLARKESSK